jgi:hypothetical protein
LNCLREGGVGRHDGERGDDSRAEAIVNRDSMALNRVWRLMRGSLWVFGGRLTCLYAPEALADKLLLDREATRHNVT